MAVEHGQGAVVALQGAWGSGKSWLLHAAEKELGKQPEATRPLWIQFSPWALSGSDALVEALIKEIAGQVKLEATGSERATKITELGDRLLEFAENLSVIRHLAAPAAFINPALGAAVAVVGHGAQYISGAAKDTRPFFKRLATAYKGLYPPPPEGRPALLELRGRVIKALQELARPLVVVLDDLDRMSPREVAEIVQTVKAVANFPSVIYVLAFDPQVISESLEQSLSLPPGGGRRYLEKIVQITVDVPQPPRFLLRDATERALAEALSFANWAPLADFTDDLSATKAALHVAALMETPRDINRLRVRLQIAFTALRGEICPADILLIEALRLKAPSLIDWIEAHHADVLRAEGVEHHADYLARGSIRKPDYKPPVDGDESSPWRQALIQFLGETLGTVSSSAVDAALRTLFDAYGTKQERGAVRPFRLQALRNWTRWLAQVSHDKILDNAQIIDLLEASAQIDARALWPSLDAFVDFDLRLRVFISSISADRLERAASLYIAAIEHFGMPDLRHACRHTLINGTSFLDPVFNRAAEVYSEEDVYCRKIFDNIFRSALDAGLCMPAFYALVTPGQPWQDGQAQADREAAWREAAEKELLQSARLGRNGTDLIEMAFYLGQWSSPSAPAEDVLRPLFKADPEQALELCFNEKSLNKIEKLFFPDPRSAQSSDEEGRYGLLPRPSISPEFIQEFADKVPLMKVRVPELFEALGQVPKMRSQRIIA